MKKDKIEEIRKKIQEQTENYIKYAESTFNRKITKKTRNKIVKVLEIVYLDTKYNNLKKILSPKNRHRLLIYFLLLGDKLKIDKKFTNQEEKHYFNMSYEFFATKYKGYSKATFNRNINLFVVLGVIGKENPFGRIYYTTTQLDNAYVKGEKYKSKYRELVGKRLERDVIYRVESLYCLKDFTATLLKNADGVAKKLFDNNFTIGAMSSIYIYRILGEKAVQTCFYGIDRKTETSYSLFLSENIKNAIIEEVSKKGYTTKEEIFENLKNKGCLVAKINNDTTKELRTKERPSLKNTFNTEFKRTIGVFLNENKEYKYCVANEKMRNIFKIKSKKYIIFKEKK